MKSGQWSYSSIAEYRKCPRMWKHNHVDRLATKSTFWMRRGTSLHTHCEQYVNKQSNILPPSLLAVKPELDSLRENNATCERFFRLDREWNPCDKPSQWVKAFLDASYVIDGVMYIVDFKSGKIKDYHADQLQLYAIIGARTESVSTVKVEILYTDHAKVMHQREYALRELDEHRARWDAEASAMLEDDVYTPTPSAQSCKRCSFKSKSGGPCSEWRHVEP